MMRQRLTTSSWLLVLACGCDQVVGEPIRAGSPAVGSPCAAVECEEPALTDPKVCPKGETLWRECLRKGDGTCGWDFPACPNAGGTGGMISGSGGANGTGGVIWGSGGTNGTGGVIWGSGGTNGTGGVIRGSGGTNGSGDGASGAGGEDQGSTGASCLPDLITFHVEKPAGAPKSFCVGEQICSGKLVTILDPQGTKVATGVPQCGLELCDRCTRGVCATACPIGPRELGDTDAQMTWNGTYYTESTCGANAISCAEPHCATPGRYIARACSFAPSLNSTDGCAGFAAPASCIDVPFDYPSTKDVYITAPGAVDTDAGKACRDAIPLRCGDRVNHSTLVEGQPNLWSGYNSTQRLESGPEVVYFLQAQTGCQAVARLTNLSEDLDLLLLPECDPWSNTAVSSTPFDLQTDEVVTFSTDAVKPSFLVVDGYAGSAGTYTLEVDCTCTEP